MAIALEGQFANLGCVQKKVVPFEVGYRFPIAAKLTVRCSSFFFRITRISGSLTWAPVVKRIQSVSWKHLMKGSIFPLRVISLQMKQMACRWKALQTRASDKTGSRLRVAWYSSCAHDIQLDASGGGRGISSAFSKMLKRISAISRH